MEIRKTETISKLTAMKKEYSNLKEKTFLDLTDDHKIIDRILDGQDKAEFLEQITDMGRYMTFAELAEITDDKALQQAIDKQFDDLFNE